MDERNKKVTLTKSGWAKVYLEQKNQHDKALLEASKEIIKLEEENERLSNYLKYVLRLSNEHLRPFIADPLDDIHKSCLEALSLDEDDFDKTSVEDIVLALKNKRDD